MKKAMYAGVEVEVLRVNENWGSCDIKVPANHAKDGKWFVKSIGLNSLNNNNVFDRNVK